MPYLVKAEQEGYDTLLSFGGAWSNHIAALAAAGKEHGLNTIGIIRGEKVRNVTLTRAEQQGMKLHFITRGQFREFRQQQYAPELFTSYGKCLVIPEGGNGAEGILGAAEITRYIPADTNYVILPVGTGATMKGIAMKLSPGVNLEGILVAGNEPAIRKMMESVSHQHSGIHSSYVMGGYAKTNASLLNFLDQLKRFTSVPFEPVYTGKMMYGILDLATKGYFPRGSRLCIIHTGGLQYQNS